MVIHHARAVKREQLVPGSANPLVISLDRSVDVAPREPNVLEHVIGQISKCLGALTLIVPAAEAVQQAESESGRIEANRGGPG